MTDIRVVDLDKIVNPYPAVPEIPWEKKIAYDQCLHDIKSQPIQLTEEELGEKLAKVIYTWHIGSPWKWEYSDEHYSWEGPKKQEYFQCATAILKALIEGK